MMSTEKNAEKKRIEKRERQVKDNFKTKQTTDNFQTTLRQFQRYI